MPVGTYLSQNIRNIFQYTNQISRSGLSVLPPLIITCALNGDRYTKENNPNLPQTLEELAEQGFEAYCAGASILQVGSQFPAKEHRKLFALLRARCPDVIISNQARACRRIDQIGDEEYTTSQPRIEHLSARPETACIDATCTISDYDDSVCFMAHRDLEQLIISMRESDIKPLFEMTKITDIKYLSYLERKGLLDEPYWCEMHFGGMGVAPILDEVINATQNLPDNGLFCLVGEGAAQRTIIAQAIIMGLHVRVGMGDSIYYIPEQSKSADSNAQLVERVVRLSRDLGRSIATPSQARGMMGLPFPQEY